MTVPVAIVTGASTGIGLQTARQLARKGYRVVIATRSEQRGKEAADFINRELATRPPQLFDGADGVPGGNAEFMWLDTASLVSCRAFAARFLEDQRFGGKLHVLVCNAGISGIGLGKGERKTPEGFETTFAGNFLGHFLLVDLLLPALKATAEAQKAKPLVPVRIVTLGSVTHRRVASPPDWAAVIAGADADKQQYGKSKLASMCLAYHLQRTVLRGSGVQAIGVNPGGVASDIWRTMPPSTMRWLRPVMRWTFLNTVQGCATSVAAATAAEVDGVSLNEPGAAIYLSPYWSPQWAQRLGGTCALLFDLLGPTKGARVMRPTPVALDPKVGVDLFAACEAALARSQGL